jgi:hypothetical protein
MKRIPYKPLFLLATLFWLGMAGGCSSAEFVFLGIFKKTYHQGPTPDAAELVGGGVRSPVVKKPGYYNGNSLDSSVIAGTVFTQDTTLLPYAQVSFKKSDGDPLAPWTTFEADGRANFLIENLEMGDYLVACLYPTYSVTVLPSIHVNKTEKKNGIHVVLDSD